VTDSAGSKAAAIALELLLKSSDLTHTWNWTFRYSNEPVSAWHWSCGWELKFWFWQNPRYFIPTFGVNWFSINSKLPDSGVSCTKEFSQRDRSKSSLSSYDVMPAASIPCSLARFWNGNLYLGYDFSCLLVRFRRYGVQEMCVCREVDSWEHPSPESFTFGSFTDTALQIVWIVRGFWLDRDCIARMPPSIYNTLGDLICFPNLIHLKLLLIDRSLHMETAWNASCPWHLRYKSSIQLVSTRGE